MAKIPQVQFINVIDKINRDRQTYGYSLTSTGDRFGKSWYLTGAYGIEAKDGRTLDRYRLSHYDTDILEVKVYSGDEVVISYVKVTSASDRDGINSLLHILNADHRVTKNGALIPKRHLR